MTEIKKPLIFEKIPAIMADMQAIGKNRKNEAQKYSFRGVDDVYNEAHDVFTKHKVFTVPTVLDAHHEERKSRSGGVLIYRIYTIKYTFYAEDGSFIEATVVGEGMDSGDKAGNKAMSVAHKYALLQVLLIPTDEPKDPENESHQVDDKPKVQDKAKKAPEEYPEETKYPDVNEKDSYRNITLVLSDGKKKTMTKFDVFKCYRKVKDAIGADTYYTILGNAGYEHMNQIPDDQLPKIYAELMEAYKFQKDSPEKPKETEDEYPF